MKLLLFSTMCALCTIQCRKYDIETESIKLYGEDINAVLLRFRKSPEYLSILEDKVKELRAQLNQMNENVNNYYGKLLEDKVVELMGFKPESEKRLRSLRSKFKPDLRNPRQFLRQSISSTPYPANRLDQYLKLRQSVTAEKANLYKDMGFEYAGYAIHTIIKNMGPDDTPGRSTKLPFGGDYQHGKPTPTTTEHRGHIVISTTDSDVTAAEEATKPAEIFRYTYKHRSV